MCYLNMNLTRRRKGFLQVLNLPGHNKKENQIIREDDARKLNQQNNLETVNANQVHPQYMQNCLKFGIMLSKTRGISMATYDFSRLINLCSEQRMARFGKVPAFFLKDLLMILFALSVETRLNNWI